MRATEDYLLDVSPPPDGQFPAALVERIFGMVWRWEFSAPGFCLVNLRPDVDSHRLRALMVRLQDQLSDLAVHRRGAPFACRSLGRFDQQETTKFHLDGATAASLLVLGYEPSRVRSRLCLADYSHCAFDLGLEPLQFLKDFNPMFGRGEAALAPYVTELPQPEASQTRILLINNSSLPFTEARSNPLGVLHKAEILTPSATERRIVNSLMLVQGAGPEALGKQQQQEFIDTEKVSPKVYG
jgi:hypothetical protein